MKGPVVLHGQGGQEVQAFDQLQVDTSSDGFGWQGIQLAVGSNRGINADDVMVDGHHISMNLADSPLVFEIRERNEWIPVRLAPRAFWINPEGRPFSMRHRTYACWATCTIAGSFLDAIAGGHHELRYGCNVADEVLSGIFLALVGMLRDRQNYSETLADKLIHVFVKAIALRHGVPAADLPPRGGIAPSQLQSLLAWLNERIEEPLTVEQMATHVGLSAAHFSREFKRSMSVSPWGYIVAIRLKHARNLLAEGNSVKVAARLSGFSDQFHLSRLFKQHYGVTPSSFRKEHSR